MRAIKKLLWQACFLTRGDLYVSWEKGRDTFDRLLIDADWCFPLSHPLCDLRGMTLLFISATTSLMDE